MNLTIGDIRKATDLLPDSTPVILRDPEALDYMAGNTVSVITACPGDLELRWADEADPAAVDRPKKRAVCIQ